MKKQVLFISIAVLLVAGMAQATAIRSMSATNAGTAFVGGSGVLTMSGMGGINVEYEDDTTTTYGSAQFSLNTTRTADTSAGGMASATFAGGSFSYKDSGSIVLLSGSITSFSLSEFVNNSGMFIGTGSFTVTGGTLQADFGPAGSMVDISYSVTPSTISNFSTSFTGSSNMTVLPIPEPATMALLIPAILALRNRRNSK
ncbi:MAG: hypothetical protein WC765_01300 [Phycisphaerae bacterium]|jgi:hypothetical protein